MKKLFKGLMKNLQGAKQFSQTATGTAIAIGTQGTPTSPARIFITDIAVSSDKNGAIVLVKAGGTIVFQQMLAGQGTPVAFVKEFETPIIITADKNATVEVDGSGATGTPKVNFSGFIV